MRISQNLLTGLLLLSLFSGSLHSQDSLQYKKLYLHTDREYYFQGDTLWFKGYYLDGQDQQFIDGHYSMYVDLVDGKARAVSSQVFPVDNGVATGRLTLPDSTEPGKYLLRAFTDFQRNMGEEAFFYKTLEVLSIRDLNEQREEKVTHELPKIDVAFLPEGGFLLAGQDNVLGIKAIDERGKGISVKGRILDGRGKMASVFNTRYKGMASIHFQPKKNEVYVAEIEGYPGCKYEIGDISEEGIKLEYVGESRYALMFRGTTNSRRFQNESYVFAIMHRGEVIYQQEFVQEGKNIPIKVNRSVLPGGINRFVLLDKHLRPISERLLFVKKDGFHRVSIKPDLDNYNTRSQVRMELIDEDWIGSVEFSSLSLTVVDEKSIGEHGPSMNIQSWLLLDSELKGNLETPSDYFMDDDSISSDAKLNLLMLTQGWSRYIWETLPEKGTSPGFHEAEGFSIKGNVTRNYFKSPVENGIVNLTLFNGEYYFTSETRTDTNGLFTFDKLHFADTAWIFLQARNEKGKSFRTVSVNPLFKDSPPVSETYLPGINQPSYIPVELQHQKYFSELSLRDYLLKTGSILIEEVEVVAKKGDGHHRKMYSQPSSSLKVTLADYSYPDVFAFLQGKVSGLTVTYAQGEVGLEPQIRIRQFGSIHGSTDVLFLLNEMPVSKEVIQYLPLCDIDVIDVLKSIGETSIFGITGANGVIAVYTKRGVHADKFNPYTPGTISEKIYGYSAYREFYSPAYSSENIDSERPDHRISLYWNPDIITENGKASVSFFTSDNLSRYKVFVEGITSKGEPCLGTAEFVVKQEIK